MKSKHSIGNGLRDQLVKSKHSIGNGRGKWPYNMNQLQITLSYSKEVYNEDQLMNIATFKWP